MNVDRDTVRSRSTDPAPEEFDTYAGVLEARATTEPRINDEHFWRAIDDLEERYE